MQTLKLRDVPLRSRFRIVVEDRRYGVTYPVDAVFQRIDGSYAVMTFSRGGQSGYVNVHISAQCRNSGDHYEIID